MDAIPEHSVTMATLAEWYRTKEQLDLIKAKEALLRPVIFKHFFPNPKEGSNNFTLPDGYILNATHAINRSVDEAALTALQPKFQELHLNADVLIKRKPELAITEYRKLTAEELLVVDQALIIKPGIPTLAIKAPSTRAKK